MTREDAEALLRIVESHAPMVAGYHAERASYGGASFELHARAQTFATNALEVVRLAREQMARADAAERDAGEYRLDAESAARAAADAERHNAQTIAQRDYFEDQIGRLAARVGCEEEWSNVHAHACCIDDAIDALEKRAEAAEQRATAAEAEVARLRALLGPAQEAARLFFDLEAARARIQNLRARGCDGQADDAEEACIDMHDRMRAALATVAGGGDAEGAST
jgi:hypothetical protein